MNFSVTEDWKLPKNWQTASIGELTFDWKGGASLKPEDFMDEGFPILHKGAIQRNGKIEIDAKKKTFATNKFVKASPNSIVNKSYLAVTLRDLVPSGPSIGLIANLKNSVNQEYLLAQGAYGFQINKKRLDADFLVWLSNYEPFRQYIKRYAVGSTQIHIRTPVFQDIKIPLPPLAEQKRIAAVLDKADSLREKRRAALKKLDHLLQSVFLDMFGDPVSNPKGWEKDTLGNVTEIVSGSTPDTNNEDFWDGEINWVTPKDLSGLNSIFLETTSRKITESGLRSCSSRMLPVNSVLFSSRAPIGHIAINTTPMCTNQGFKSFIPKANKIISEYLYYWLKLNKQMLEDLGTGATFKEVSKSVVSKVLIALPPTELQKQFAQTLEKIETQKLQQKSFEKNLNNLFQSLQQRAFAGELFEAAELASEAGVRQK